MQDAWLLVLPIIAPLPPEERPTEAVQSLPAPETHNTHGGGVFAQAHAKPLTSKGPSKSGSAHQRNGRSRARQGRGGGKGCGAGEAEPTVKRNGHNDDTGNTQESVGGNCGTAAVMDAKKSFWHVLPHRAKP